MELQPYAIACINYREPLLWVVMVPLSFLALVVGRRLVPWTAAARLLRWPLRIGGVLFLAIAGVVLGSMALAFLPLLLSGGQEQFCTHYVRHALLLPGVSAVAGIIWASARHSATPHTQPAP